MLSGMQTNLVLAMRNVPDISESDLILLLSDVLSAHSSSSGSAAEAPAPTLGPTPTPMPTPALYLSHLVGVPLSQPLLRTALRAQISDAQDVRTLIVILRNWLDARAEAPLVPGSGSAPGTGAGAGAGAGADGMMESEDREQAQQGARMWGTGKKMHQSKRKRLASKGVLVGAQEKVPPLEQVSRVASRRVSSAVCLLVLSPLADHPLSCPRLLAPRTLRPTTQILTFLTALLDTSFPLLLSTPSTHQTLRTLSRSLSIHLASLSNLSLLRGPLNAFAQLEADRVRLAKANGPARAGAAAANAKGAMRGMRQVKNPGTGSNAISKHQHRASADPKDAQRYTGGGIAPADGAGAKSKRAVAYESSALVGLYSVEVLEI